jgi:hypothetical protein
MDTVPVPSRVELDFLVVLTRITDALLAGK